MAATIRESVCESSRRLPGYQWRVHWVSGVSYLAYDEAHKRSEAIEDLTGGVTTELFTTDILDKDKFWKEELLKVNDQFLFGCATGCFDDWKGGGGFTDRKGVVAMHAYSIMEAREINGERLVKIRYTRPGTVNGL